MRRPDAPLLAAGAALALGLAIFAVGFLTLGETEASKRAPAAPPKPFVARDARPERGEGSREVERPSSSAPLDPGSSPRDDPSLGASGVEALALAARAHVAREGAIRAAVLAARAGEIDPVDLGLRLHEIGGSALDAGPALLALLVEEPDPAIAFKLAQALAALQDDAPIRRATVEALRRAEPGTRAVGLLALLGRTEPEAVALAAECFVGDVPAARGTAGFLLNQVPEALPAPLAATVRETARAALADPAAAAPDRVREEAAGLLGRPGAPEVDVALLERTMLDAPERTVRGRAFVALVETGAGFDRIGPACARVLSDESAPPELRAAARAYLTSGRE